MNMFKSEETLRHKSKGLSSIAVKVVRSSGVKVRTAFIIFKECTAQLHMKCLIEHWLHKEISNQLPSIPEFQSCDQLTLNTKTLLTEGFQLQFNKVTTYNNYIWAFSAILHLSVIWMQFSIYLVFAAHRSAKKCFATKLSAFSSRVKESNWNEGLTTSLPAYQVFDELRTRGQKGVGQREKDRVTSVRTIHDGFDMPSRRGAPWTPAGCPMAAQWLLAACFFEW